jgi:hypothetical protein
MRQVSAGTMKASWTQLIWTTMNDPRAKPREGVAVVQVKINATVVDTRFARPLAVAKVRCRIAPFLPVRSG